MSYLKFILKYYRKEWNTEVIVALGEWSKLLGLNKYTITQGALDVMYEIGKASNDCRQRNFELANPFKTFGRKLVVWQFGNIFEVTWAG